MQFKPLMREIIEDRAHIIEQAHLKAKELNTKYAADKLELTWRDIATIPTPQGFTATLPTEDKEEPADNSSTKKEAASV